MNRRLELFKNYKQKNVILKQYLFWKLKDDIFYENLPILCHLRNHRLNEYTSFTYMAVSILSVSHYNLLLSLHIPLYLNLMLQPCNMHTATWWWLSPEAHLFSIFIFTQRNLKSRALVYMLWRYISDVLNI